MTPSDHALYSRLMRGEKITHIDIPRLSVLLHNLKRRHKVKFSKQQMDSSHKTNIYFMSKEDILMNKQNERLYGLGYVSQNMTLDGQKI